jgi:hypothetical protein
LKKWKEAEMLARREIRLLTLQEDKDWAVKYLAGIEQSLYDMRQLASVPSENVKRTVEIEASLNLRKTQVLDQLKRWAEEIRLLESA